MKSVRETEDAGLSGLMLELREALRELSRAYERLDLALDADLVESSVYQINAAMSRCDYLYRAVKDREARARVEQRAFPAVEPARPSGLPVVRAALGRADEKEEESRWI